MLVQFEGPGERLGQLLRTPTLEPRPGDDALRLEAVSATLTSLVTETSEEADLAWLGEPPAPAGERSLVLRLQEEIRRLQGLVIAIQEGERRRISRELHDEAGQLLTTSIFKLDLCASKVAAGHPEVGEVLSEVREVLAACAERIHTLSLDLRPPMLEDLGLVPTVEWYLRQVRTKAATRLDLEACVSEWLLPVDVRTAAFRIIQESIANVLKHAGASRVRVFLRTAGGRLALGVADDGRGFDPRLVKRAWPCQPSLGIVGMRERAELLHGKLRIFSHPGRGTLVYARFPLA